MLPNLSKKESVSSVLKKLDILTNEQIKNLTGLKFSNGENILNLEDRNFLYEIVWLIKEKGYDIAYNFLSADWEKVLGSHNIRKKMLFENPLMEPAKDKFYLDMNIYKTRVEVEAGEKCRKCGSTETISLTKQTRSADEAATIKITCINCKFRWTAQ